MLPEVTGGFTNQVPIGSIKCMSAKLAENTKMATASAKVIRRIKRKAKSVDLELVKATNLKYIQHLACMGYQLV